MKKTLFIYSICLTFIFATYFLFSLLFATLFQYTHLSPDFYNVATKICAYLTILLAAIGFALAIEKKRLYHALVFCIVFSVISILLLWHHLQLLNILLKDLVFICGVLVVHFLKKEA